MSSRNADARGRGGRRGLKFRSSKPDYTLAKIERELERVQRDSALTPLRRAAAILTLESARRALEART